MPLDLFVVVSSCPTQSTLHKTERDETMEICVKSFDGEKYTVEVGVDDTTADIRRKVATAAELCEDGFDMSFGGKLLAEGDYITQLSAGDTVVLTKTKSQKDDAIAALRDLGETRLTTWKFKGLRDPKLIHLFLQAEVVTEIPDHFLEGATFEALDLSGVPGVTAINRAFLRGCMSLRTADLSGWSNVARTGSAFLIYCNSLTTLDISGWGNMKHVGSCFLSKCHALRTLDLSGWHNVRQIGDYFLEYCTALEILDLSGWSNVTRVDNFFLSNCRSLTTLNISGWNNVTQIGKNFLDNCIALKTLDLSGLTTVQRIETNFLIECTIPTSSINITGSSSVVSDYVQSRNLIGDMKRSMQQQCVCM